jgi:hypothetical protein
MAGFSNVDRRQRLYPNPITKPLKEFFGQFDKLNFIGVNIPPSAIIAFVLVLVVIILGIFWPYGVLVITTERIWDFAITTRDEMKGKTLIEKVPYAITFGIFFLVWFPFVLICSPFYLFGIVVNAIDRSVSAH